MEEYQKIYLKDYKPYEYDIFRVELWIDFFDDQTLVRSKLSIRKKVGLVGFPSLVLKGEELTTESVFLNGIKLLEDDYIINKNELIITPKEDEFVVETICQIEPHKNTSLEGIYKSGGLFCSQCEAEGFRKITWHPDRPDVMSEYFCNISGDLKKYPILLSNGNLINSGELSGGRHFAKWHDPILKSSYLFAVVAGDLYQIEDTYKTRSGKDVALKIFTEPENRSKCFHAIDSLKKSMKWDEDVFNREYDLNIYMIVAVSAFNMGAMENKGLNIFNSNYVLADEKTGTDDDFLNIESVVAHEYFHNWTGNRITLANWFQLSLKEGLTVFRDQLFSFEVSAGTISRIRDVRILKARQFPEDAGPFSHPVRPKSYIEMNNFYTATVYEKGAEIVRMIYNWLGRENFLKGMETYFEKFDCMAVTCEDFIEALSVGSLENLMEFMAWYEQSGTPYVEFDFDYDKEKNELKAKISQRTPKTPGQQEKVPLPIPIKLAFFNKLGQQVEFFVNKDEQPKKEAVILLNKADETFVFNGIKTDVIPSLFRGFSAPVRFYSGSGIKDDIFLMSWDSDPYNRWDASRKVFFKAYQDFYERLLKGEPLDINEDIYKAFSLILNDDKAEKSLIAEILSLPLEAEFIQELMSKKILVNPLVACRARNEFAFMIAKKFEKEFFDVFSKNNSKVYEYSSQEISKRRLKNSALNYLSLLENSDFIFDIYNKSNNMTDSTAALKALVSYEDENSKNALFDFYKKWNKDLVVIDKWFLIQAGSKGENTFENVKKLMNDGVFSIKNPNKVRSLIGGFFNNPSKFHMDNGLAYDFASKVIIELSNINPQISARLVSYLGNFKGFDEKTGAMMKENLLKIYEIKDLPRDVYEMVSKALEIE